jgi:hypothetical protein
MKNLCSLFLCFLMTSAALFSGANEVNGQSANKIEKADFTGQWTIDIKGGSVGWLEVRQEDGYLDGDLLWIGGSVTPVAHMYINGSGDLIVARTAEVVRKRDGEGKPTRAHTITSWLEIKRKDDQLSGYLYTPRRDGLGIDSTSFAGTKLPPVPPAPDLSKLKYGKPVNLFNGKDLTGWKPLKANDKLAFRVIDGVLVNDAVQPAGQPKVRYGNLRTEQVFEDFNLKLEVNVPKGSNSGVYLRGMYEIQIFDTYERELDSHHMGAVYSRIAPTVKAEKPAGTWQSLDITLYKRHITVILNGVKIIDNQPVYGPTGGAIISDVFSPGPIYLQGDHGPVSFRNFVLTPVI